MTERIVRRGMLIATIGVAGLLTSLAVAGIVVTTRGPQVQALPLVRTLIAQDPDGTAAAGTLAPATADHAPPAWPQPQQTTTTASTTASSVEISGDSQNVARSQPTSSRSTVYTNVGPVFPSYPTPPPTSGFLTPPTSGGPASKPASDDPGADVIPRAEDASSPDPPASTGDPAAMDPVTPTTLPADMKGEDPAEEDDDREVISPRLRVRTADDHDPNDPDQPDDPQ